MRTTLREWAHKHLKDEFLDIQKHGASCGFTGITYYTETGKLYNKHRNEIWDMVAEDANQMGLNSPLELIATFSGAKGVACDTTFKNLMIWYAIERIAADAEESVK